MMKPNTNSALSMMIITGAIAMVTACTKDAENTTPPSFQSPNQARVNFSPAGFRSEQVDSAEKVVQEARAIFGLRSTLYKPQCFSGSLGSGEPFQGSSKASKK